jgi:hypothetical protein
MQSLHHLLFVRGQPQPIIGEAISNIISDSAWIWIAILCFFASMMFLSCASLVVLFTKRSEGLQVVLVIS